VYLCPAFFKESTFDKQRALALVHAMSHFHIMGGTLDYVRGKDACLNFARGNPNAAYRNADSLAYSSEEAK